VHLDKLRRAGFDTETTGPDPQEARIVTAALVVRGGGRADQAFTWLINPGVPIPNEAAAVHGITTEKAVAEGQDPKTALEEIADRLAAALNYGMPVIAFNLSFDWTTLDRDLRRNGLAPMGERLTTQYPALVDPHVIDKQVDRYRKGSGMRKLQPTADVYGVKVTDWHTADADRSERISNDRIAQAKELTSMKLSHAATIVGLVCRIQRLARGCARYRAENARLQRLVNRADTLADRAVQPATPTPEVERLKRAVRQRDEIIHQLQNRIDAYQQASEARDWQAVPAATVA
jgi:hypothetical protein